MNDEHYISETANSAKCSWRQNSSDGCRMVGMRSMPSGFTVPSRIGQVRGLLVMPMLSCRFMMLHVPSLLFSSPFGRALFQESPDALLRGRRRRHVTEVLHRGGDAAPIIQIVLP